MNKFKLKQQSLEDRIAGRLEDIQNSLDKISAKDSVELNLYWIKASVERILRYREQLDTIENIMDIQE